MMDPALQQFLSERLKKKTSSAPNEAELQQELNDWLPTAVTKTHKLFRVTHPVKFSHPDVKNTSEIRVSAERKPDGFLRSGNVAVEPDMVFDTAANIPILKFLSLKLADGLSILAHLENDSDLVKQQLELPSLPYTDIRQGLLQINQLPDRTSTSDKIKQVYFPVDGGYHLLSLLTPSGLMFKLKERINSIRFAETTKQAREARRNQQHHDTGYQEFYGLTEIGFGGTKPQNISVLNNQNGGTAYLLPSLPPPLTLNKLQPPKTDFFLQSVYAKHFLEKFQALHALFQDNVPANIHVREGRDYWLLQIAEQVMETVWALRELPGGWSEHGQLPPTQKIWLDQDHAEQREQADDWLDAVIVALADWLAITYKHAIGERQAKALGDAELKHFRQLLDDHREVLR
uniref:type I-F CRISPR-associated protein Csy1 n=1 Tax=Methylomonas sp. PHL2-19 TaxID=3438878 RepID=UPI00402B2792